MSERYDICAGVVSHLPYDARVWKQARTLADAGYRVKLIGCSHVATRTQRRVAAGIDVVEVPLPRGGGRLSAPRRLRTLSRLWTEIARTDAGAYHAHNIHVGPPMLWAASRRRARIVYDAHEIYGLSGGGAFRAERAAARAKRPLERRMVRASDAVITTNFSRAELLGGSYGRQGIVVLANVPRRQENVVPVDPGFPTGRRVLLYQGGIYARRAFRATLDALALLEDVDFAILGFGREGDIASIRRWAAEAGVASRVHFFGPRPFDELVATAAAADVGIVPLRPLNLNQVLGDTNKLHEYLMGGLPVVASDLPEIRRVLEKGTPRVGELFDPESPQSIAAAIRAVLADPREHAARRVEARRLALAELSWEIEAPRLLELYSGLLSAPSLAAAEVVAAS
jgi:glycosyltransferase involved in cell wall biosynthesis